MKLYRLQAKQYLPITTEVGWEFLSNPTNLKNITPEHMGFKIISGGEKPMFPGQIIQYKVAPFPGYSTKWVSEITHVKHGEYFVDEQRFGPYALWHHKHFLNPIKNGVEMEDIIDLKLPFGVFGQLGYPLIKKQLLKIFLYREKKFNELFGEMEGKRSSFSLKSV